MWRFVLKRNHESNEPMKVRRPNPALNHRMNSGTAAFCLGLFICTWVHPQPLPATASLCEVDWSTRGNTRPAAEVDFEYEVKGLESRAAAGDQRAQYRLGFVRRSKDGKWALPAGDYAFNLWWAEKAASSGHRAAGARVVEIKFRLQTPSSAGLDDYLSALILAAEAGNSWEATELMNFTLSAFPRCSDEGREGGFCSGTGPRLSSLIAKVDLKKWAEIAAIGGNPAAQEWLCAAARDGGSPAYGQPKDPVAAARWCLVAAHNSCAFDKGSLLDAYPASRAREDAHKFSR